ncbi:helix-turn-helix domain-containing protein [Peribacillus deserti]|uniref:Helix-turn-helix domain-containing protein n=1 Tax=Peribacillus deserti TaxID=673318 RepID=A0A2N5M4R7_9BACI|nr:hypothetical protein CUU66_13920 [Peribacillus deserti]
MEELNNRKQHEMLLLIQDDDLLSTSQIADLLGVSKETARRWFRKKYIESVTPVGHFRLTGKEFKEFLMWNRRF